jgi:hypothetical protein
VVVPADVAGVVATVDPRDARVEDGADVVLAPVVAPHPPSKPTRIAPRTTVVTVPNDRCMLTRRSYALLPCTSL